MRENGKRTRRSNMKVDLLLVNPGNRLEQFASLNELATVAQPLGLAMLAAFVRDQGFSVAIIDAEANFWTPEETIAEIKLYQPILIGLSAFTTKMTAAGKVLKLVKAEMPEVKTVIGGHHASAIPIQTLNDETVDFVIKGEGYFPIAALLQKLKDKITEPKIAGVWFKAGDKIVKGGQAAGITKLDDLPKPAYDLLPMSKYRAHHWQAWDYDLDQSGFALVYTSLGCPFRCEYCSVNVVYADSKIRYRSPESVTDEIELLVNTYGIKHIEIIDDTFTLNYKRVTRLCDEMIKRRLGDKINAWCFSRTDRTDPALMKKLKRAGINWVFMGFESGNDEILQGVNKRQTIDQIKTAADNVHAAGIHIGGNYVFGLHNDTHETMRQTLDLAKELNTEYANFFLMMAYPGTQLRDLAIDMGYELPAKWGQYGFFAPDALPMRNEQLSAQEILAFRDGAFKEYFGSERYQTMLESKFGPAVIKFLREKVLSKDIVRIS